MNSWSGDIDLTDTGPDTEHPAVHSEPGLLALVTGQQVRHQGLAGVDGGLAGVVQQDHPHGQQQHSDGLGGQLRVQALADVEEEWCSATPNP